MSKKEEAEKELPVERFFSLDLSAASIIIQAKDMVRKIEKELGEKENATLSDGVRYLGEKANIKPDLSALEKEK